jgi:hypothetical protein
MNARRRIERLEAIRDAPYETPMELEIYFKHLENERRKQAREPPIPLTPEEERWERKRDEDPEFRAYMERISKQRSRPPTRTW